MLHRRFYSAEIAHGPLTHIEVEGLAQGHVERAYASTDRRHKRTFYAHQIFFEGIEGGLRKPFASLLMRLSAGKDLLPHNLPFAAISLFHGCIDHLLANRRYLCTDTIARDERHCRRVGHNQFSVLLLYLVCDIDLIHNIVLLFS